MPNERISNDPNNEVPPDFTHERYNNYRQLLISSDAFPDITNEEQVTDHLKGTWNAENEEQRMRWQQQVKEDLQLEEERR